MTLRSAILAITCLAALAVSVWAGRLQITTSAVPSKFSFAAMEPVRDESGVAAESRAAETIETYARPLFSWNRRPYQVREEAEPEAEPAPPDIPEEGIPAVEIERPRLKLLGTEPLAQLPSALITLEETGASSWFRKGELVVGWRITKIGTHDIELSNENDESVNMNISLYSDK